MWERVRRLFESGEADAETGAAESKLGQLWVSLVRLGTARGLPLADAEDLAQESILAAVEAFDPARGDFGAFCRTILSNMAVNFHRAARRQEPLPEDGGSLVDPDDGPGWALYRRQCRERADRVVSKVLAALDEEAAAFLLILAEVHAELRHGEVSEAARRAGLSPQQGWDVFRRIQRRFQGVENEIPRPEQPPSRLDGPRFLPKPTDFSGTERESFDLLRERYTHFKAGLAARARRRLSALLRR